MTVVSTRPIASIIAGIAVMAVATLSAAVAQEPVTDPVESEAWFWRRAGLPVPLPAVDPANHLPVAAVAGQWDKVALLRLRGEVAPAAGTTLSIAAPGDDVGADINAEAASLRACVVLGPWEPAIAAGWDALPELDCEVGVVGTWAGAGSERRIDFDLSALSTAWSAGASNQGVALVPDISPGATDTWQVAFHGARLGGITTAGPASSPAGPGPPAAPAPADEAPPEPSFDPIEELPPVEASDPAAISVAAPPPPRALGSDRPPRRSAVSSTSPPGRPMLPIGIDRDLESVAFWALALFGSVLLALGLVPGSADATASRTSRRDRELRVGAALCVVVVFATAWTWSRAARQPLLWAQVPYVAGGILAALVLGTAAFTMLGAALLDSLPATHRLRRRIVSHRQFRRESGPRPT